MSNQQARTSARKAKAKVQEEEQAARKRRRRMRRKKNSIEEIEQGRVQGRVVCVSHR
jgi:hypothetical protein